MKQLYISADGIVMMCCWFGNKPYVDEYLDFYGSIDIDLLNVKNYPLDTILKSGLLEKIERSWESDNPLSTCVRFCAKDFDDTSSDHNEDDGNEGNNKLTSVNL